MKHIKLLFSSIGSLCFYILLFSIFHNFPNPWLYYKCLATSIWNHGTTNIIAKWTDRFMVSICVVHNMYCFIISSNSFISWCGIGTTISGVFFYFVSKKIEPFQKQVDYHLFSHLFGTISGLCLGIISIHKKR